MAEDVLLAERHLEREREVEDDGVADEMAESVVHELEMIEVEHEERVQSPVRPPDIEHPVDEVRRVRFREQSRHRIVAHFFAERFVLAVITADILERAVDDAAAVRLQGQPVNEAEIQNVLRVAEQGEHGLPHARRMARAEPVLHEERYMAAERVTLLRL